MIKRLFKRKQTALDEAIAIAIRTLDEYDPTSAEYQKIIDNLEKLYKMKTQERSVGVSLDTIAIIAGNLLITGLILGYEKTGTITSKALNYVIKGRV